MAKNDDGTDENLTLTSLLEQVKGLTAEFESQREELTLLREKVSDLESQLENHAAQIVKMAQARRKIEEEKFLKRTEGGNFDRNKRMT